MQAHLFFLDLILYFITNKMSFNPNDYVTPYITLEEVLEIKKAFDLFDRDLGGAIDPRGIKLCYFRTQSCYQLSRY